MMSRPLSRRSFLGAALLGLAGSACILPACSRASSASSLSSDSQNFGQPASDSATTMQKRSIFVFDTEVSLSAACSEEVMDQAVQRCYYFENILSRTVEGSDVWRINQAQGAPVQVAAETAACIQASLGYSRSTQGLFDITIGAVSSLWDFHNNVKPDDSAIQEALSHVGYENVQVQDNTVTLADPQAKIDLGGIAKGFIADDLHDFFVEAGCKSGIINLGGNIMLIGTKEDGSPWHVGVQDPNDARNVCIASADCADESVVTSGLYERYFEQDGVMYYHILDPRTGYPAQTDLLASSICSKKSIDGDALATALFIMGKDRALEFIEQSEGLEALVVDGDDQISLSAGARFQAV